MRSTTPAPIAPVWTSRYKSNAWCRCPRLTTNGVEAAAVPVGRTLRAARHPHRHRRMTADPSAELTITQRGEIGVIEKAVCLVAGIGKLPSQGRSARPAGDGGTERREPELLPRL